MQTENKIFEDFAKLLNGVAGTVAGMGREAQESGRERLKGWLGGMDFVSRDEFEAVKAMAAAARDEVEALKAEVAALRPVPYAGPATAGGGIPSASASASAHSSGTDAPAGI